MKNKISLIFQVLLVLSSLIIQGIIRFENISFYLMSIFIILLYVYLKDKKLNRNISIFSCLFSFIFTLGNLRPYKYQSNIVFIALIIVELIGLYFLFSKILLLIIELTKSINIESDNNKVKSRKVFILSAVIGFICLLPYFLKFYPGILTNDSYSQVLQATNMYEYSNHHPWIHTLIIKVFYNIGYFIGNSKNSGVSCYILFQMLCATFSFSYVIYVLHKNKTNKYILLLTWMFFFLLPFNAIYSITLWKDVVFSYIILVLTTFILDHYKNNKQWDLKSKIIFSILFIFFALLRANGLIAFFIFIMILFILYRKDFKQLFIPIIISLVVIFTIKIPIMNYFNVVSTDFVESLSIPLQQVAFVIKKDGKISSDEMIEIKKIIDVDKLLKDRDGHYYISDPVKHNVRDYGHQDYLVKHKFKYLKLWISIGIKNIKLYFEAYVRQTSGYYFHNYGKYWVYSTGLKTSGSIGDLGLVRHNYLPYILSKGIGLLLTINSKIYYSFWSIAMSFYILIISMFISIEKKKNILSHVISLALMITIFIATPVACEFRYAYPLFLSFIVLLLFSLFKIIGGEENETKRYKKR